MASYKPSDLFIGLVDLFSVLLPGGLLVALFLDELSVLSDGLLPPLEDPLRGWVAFVVAAFVLGHILKHLSAQIFNRVYRTLYYPRACRGVERVTRSVEESLGEERQGIDAFTWARSFVRATNEAGAREVERFEADSKFFRSLALVVAAGGVRAALVGAWATAVASFLLFSFALWRFCHLRRSEARRTFEYYTILKAEAGGAAGSGATL